MFGTVTLDPVIQRMSCQTPGECSWSTHLAQFKQAPDATRAASGFSDIQFGVHTIPADVVHHMISTYWPGLIGAVLVFLLIVFGQQSASRYAVGVTLLLQMMVVLAAQ